MKQKDLVVVVAVVIFAATFSYVISSKIFSSPKQQNLKSPVVEKISGDFPNPQTNDSYKAFFNADSINPTQLIDHGDVVNPKPFGKQ